MSKYSSVNLATLVLDTEYRLRPWLWLNYQIGFYSKHQHLFQLMNLLHFVCFCVWNKNMFKKNTRSLKSSRALSFDWEYNALWIKHLGVAPPKMSVCYLVCCTMYLVCVSTLTQFLCKRGTLAIAFVYSGNARQRMTLIKIFALFAEWLQYYYHELSTTATVNDIRTLFPLP